MEGLCVVKTNLGAITPETKPADYLSITTTGRLVEHKGNDIAPLPRAALDLLCLWERERRSRNARWLLIERRVEKGEDIVEIR